MNIPRVFREQFIEYEKAGFHVRRIEPSKGSHAKVWFEEFPEQQILTKNIGDYRAIKNNIARFRALAARAKEKSNEENLKQVGSVGATRGGSPRQQAPSFR